MRWEERKRVSRAQGPVYAQGGPTFSQQEYQAESCGGERAGAEGQPQIINETETIGTSYGKPRDLNM